MQNYGWRRWIFEDNGEGPLNPSLLLWTVSGIVNISVSISCVVLAFLTPLQAIPLLAIAATTTLGALTSFGIGWLKLARAKIAADSKVLIATQQALGKYANYDVDERDEDQIADERYHSEGR